MSAEGDNNMPRERTAFFYGTLMAPQVLYRVIWGTSKVSAAQRERLTIQPALLDDFCRHKVRYADYPGIIQQAGHSVRGTYVTGLTDFDIVKLDYFEGCQYMRKKVQVKVLAEEKDGDKGKESDKKVEVVAEAMAETYIFLDKSDLVEEEWNFDKFVREKMWRWTDASEEYEGEFP
jgi:Gamma-glutamyl cyclotransferase, AIG2-like